MASTLSSSYCNAKQTSAFSSNSRSRPAHVSRTTAGRVRELETHLASATGSQAVSFEQSALSGYSMGTILWHMPKMMTKS
ncbi:Mediator of RNA polymerase II transcription subunit 14 [Frankliniella fusca]|uniref:Mediator of RNA polymerase II transcription subunit 14 n=1 Tax=Frankliniella fusca TaxID=407009 RepID=A0AAE1LS48_9NEOP|nr:Mediator of RNA polymerase II transcription subunit 14 [Frankliniella fusca]